MMKHLLPPVVLLLLSIIPTETEVVTSMGDCNEFFLQQTPPNIPGILEGGNILYQNRYKPICQTFRDTRRFVTLYDVTNKIPVFSAAKYIAGAEGPRSYWKVEPQLEDITKNRNMAPPEASITYNHQAVNTDYINKEGFERGHLVPGSYRCDEADKRSTFTLTNAVPQKSKFNNGRWRSMEDCVKCIMDNYCINEDMKQPFVVIGAQHSNGNFLNNKINIPSVLWSAFCCYSDKKKSWLAGAHWGENEDKGPKYMQTQTLEELKETLKIEAFPGTECPTDTSVTPLYSEPACKCHCRQQRYEKNKEKRKSPPTSTTNP